MPVAARTNALRYQINGTESAHAKKRQPFLHTLFSLSYWKHDSIITEKILIERGQTYSNTISPHVYIALIFFHDNLRKSNGYSPTPPWTFANRREPIVLSPVYPHEFRQLVNIHCTFANKASWLLPLANVQLAKVLLARFGNPSGRQVSPSHWQGGAVGRTFICFDSSVSFRTSVSHEKQEIKA